MWGCQRRVYYMGASLIISGLAPTSQAGAQNLPAEPSVDAPANKTFMPDYFARFAPRTALDMVSQIPGFSVSGGNSGGRGLGQGSGNVLINGARISGKSASPRETLARIPADNVISLKIVDGASLSIAGLSGDVLNVITRPSRFSGTWEWRPELRETQEPNIWRGKVSASGKIGKLTYTAGLDADAERGGGDGLEFERDENGEIYEIADERLRRNQQYPEGTLALTYAYSDDIVANFNATYRQLNFNSREQSDRSAVQFPGVTETVLLDRYEDEKKGEVSGDITWPVAGGSLKLISVAGFEDSPIRNRVRAFKGDILTRRDEFYSQGDEGERILRAEYSRKFFDHDWQISGETAFNFLELDNRLFELENGVFAQTVLDDPNVRVEEDRAQITLTHGRALSPRLDVQASISVEQSTLTQTGNAPNSRSFVRPKGFANFSYDAGNNLIGRFEFARQVGQLSFFDFISDVDLEDDNSKDSNSELVPRELWNYAAEIDKTFAGDNTVLLRVFYEDIENLVARVPVGVSGDVVGNIDSASSLGLKFESTLRGDTIGLAGTQINLDYFAQKTKVKDPLTGIGRRIDGRTNTFFEIDFRHDIPKTQWAYGFGIEYEREEAERDPEEINREFETAPFAQLFIERKNFHGVTANINLRNIFDIKEGISRTVHEGRRNDTPVEFTQRRERAFGRIIRMTLSGTF